METICFNKNTFYLVVVTGLAIIGMVLYQIHQQQLEQFKSLWQAEVEQERVTAKQHYQDEIDQFLKQRQIMGMQQTAFETQAHEDRERMTNPFVPPLQRGPLSLAGSYLGTPVNTPTRGEYGPFQQVGWLKNSNDIDKSMPMMGRRIHSNQWEYYTFHHNNPNIKIPVRTQGDQELFDDSTVQVSGYSGDFTFNKYELDHPRYIPY